ncbi:MAG: class I SAM-dependent methyltransferase [Planctomycetes bacterium]|nr:class I SAM-dependent methyltransferase [Planctomycetota bacterium]
MRFEKPKHRSYLVDINCPACGSTRVFHWFSAPDRFLIKDHLYQLNVCTCCTLAWVGNPPPKDRIFEHYGDHYHSIVSGGKEGGKEKFSSKWQPAIRDIHKIKSKGTILDLGCSSGNFLKSLPPDQWKRYGIEINAATAERAVVNADAEVFNGDILDAPFEPGSFDVVTAFDVLEHVYEPVEVLKKVKTWLKPDGIVFPQVPNIRSWEVSLFGSFWFGLDVPRHLFQFSPESLRYIGRTLGYEEVSIKAKPVSYFEHSTNYLIDGLIRKLGGHRGSMRKKTKPGICFRSVRKLYRTLFIKPITHLAACSGKSALSEVVFRNTVQKPIHTLPGICSPMAQNR